MTPDEVRRLDNKDAIVLIRGEKPVIDGKYDEHQPHGNRKRPLMDFVCLIVKLLKRLCVEHTDKEIERCVVAVRDDAEDGLFALSELAKLHIVAGGDALDFR